MLTDETVEALFEARSECPACRRLEVLECDGRIAGNGRLMRALLPSVTELDLHYGYDADDFQHDHIRAPHPIMMPRLKRLYLHFWDYESVGIHARARASHFEYGEYVLRRACGLRARLEPMCDGSNRCVAF